MATHHFIKKGTRYDVASKENVQIVDPLPVGTYSVDIDQHGNYYLDKGEDFQHKGRIYGKADGRAERILNTFEARPNTTGVLLTGEKGSGKTLLARLVSMLGSKKGYPTLIINHAFSGEGFNRFIAAIEQPCVVIFDEFEKVYSNKEAQAAILTLFDGVYPTKKLFIATMNEKNVSTYMLNRPGRFFYSYSYQGLDEAFIRDYCDDVLKNKDHTDQIVTFGSMTRSFNFDMLKAAVEEMNRYGEDFNTILDHLNIDLEPILKSYEIVSWDVKDKGAWEYDRKYSKASLHGPLNPMMPFNFDVTFDNAEDKTLKDDELEWDQKSFFVSPKAMKEYRPNGVSVYETDEYLLRIRPRVSDNFSYRDLL